MNLRQQAELYMKQATGRKRGPIGIGSTASYSSAIKKWIVPELGHLDLSEVKPSTVKRLVEKMTKAGLTAPSINLVVGSIKRIMRSAVDEEGQPLYPRVWDNAFMDVPAVNKADQTASIIGIETLQSVMQRAKGQSKALYVMLAASGARISELRALRAAPSCDTDSYWDSEKCVIFIRSTFAHEVYQPWPKTDSGIREIDLHPDVNSYLTQAGLPKAGWLFRGISTPDGHYCQTTADRHLKQDGVDTGFHSFRRFRITHLETQNVPDGLQRYWVGHAAKDVHQSYIKMGENIKVRKEWAIKAGFGFTL